MGRVDTSNVELEGRREREMGGWRGGGGWLGSIPHEVATRES